MSIRMYLQEPGMAQDSPQRSSDSQITVKQAANCFARCI